MYLWRYTHTLEMEMGLGPVTDREPLRFRTRCPQSSPPSPLAVREKAREENRLGVVCSGTLGWDDQQAMLFSHAGLGRPTGLESPGPFQRSWEIFFQGQEAVARTARRKCLEHRLQAWSAPSIWNTAEVEQELRLKVLKRRERQNTLVADDARTPLDERHNTLVADISSCFRMPSFAKADAVLANSWAVKSATRHNDHFAIPIHTDSSSY